MQGFSALWRSAVGKTVTAIIVVLYIAYELVGLPFDWGGEKIIKVCDLPNTEAFSDQEGKQLDLSYIYKQVHVFWVIPVWNYAARWCLNDGSSQTYYEVDKAEFDMAARNEGLTLPSESKLPFWDAFGGKLTLIAGFVLGLIGIRVLNRQVDAPQAAVNAADSTATPQHNESARAPADYYVAKGGENIGEFTETQIRAFLSEGSLSPEDFFFDATRDEWVPLTNLPHTS